MRYYSGSILEMGGLDSAGSGEGKAFMAAMGVMSTPLEL